jgi:glycine/D-amino acid oxidase-like deaminating enzyme
MKQYDYVIVGAGIAGCSVAYFLAQKKQSVLVLEQNRDLKHSASYAAGGFLSPLLGKPNAFKTLVNEALCFSVEFYQKNFKEFITQKGVLRIPKNEEDALKFQSYIPFIEVDFKQQDAGCFFPIGAQVNSLKVCESLLKNIDVQFNHKVKKLKDLEDGYEIDEQFIARNIILTTGANTKLIQEPYFKLRPVWGQRIDITTSTKVLHNYHKACSVSSSSNSSENKRFKVSIGATHHRFDCKSSVCQWCLEQPNINSVQHINHDEHFINNNTKELLEKANDIITLNDIEIKKIKFGVRACSVDYFPMVGALVDSKQTLQVFPYLSKGTHVPAKRWNYHKNMFVLNGLGGRGFVLAPYLAQQLVDFLLEKHELQEEVKINRLFKRWVKRLSH